MAKFRVIFNIDIDAENSLNAAEIVQTLLRDECNHFQYYIQNEETKEIVSCDMDENDEDAVLPISQLLERKRIEKAFNNLW